MYPCVTYYHAKMSSKLSARTSRLFLCVCLISFACLVVACSPAKGYQGPTKKPNQLAIVRGHGVTLHQVNGIEIGATSTGILVLPGRNELQLTINQSNYNTRGANTKVYQLIMNAEAGKQYSVTGKRGDGRLCAWEIDPATGQPNYSVSAGCIAAQQSIQ